MANKYHGTGVNFGVNSTIGTVTGLFQTHDHSYQSDNEVVRNGVGDSFSKTFFDLREEATFEWVAIGAGPSGTVAVTVPAVGDAATVTDSVYSAIAGTTWLVDSVDVRGSNTTAHRVTCKLSRYANITT